MKLTKILFFIITLSQFSFAQTAMENGTGFINRFFEKNHEAAISYIDPGVRDKITRSVLAQTATAIDQQLGSYQKNLSARATTEGGHEVIYYYSAFDNAKLDIKVVFNEKDKIVGFFFVPHQESPTEDEVLSSAGKDYKIKSGNLYLPGTLLYADSNDQRLLVIFIHGSGPNDRDETVYQNKPFKDLAEGLLPYGISSYRFDKRTKVAPNEFVGKDFTIDDEVTADVVNIVNYFKGNDTFQGHKIILIGHSLGGMMLPRILQKANDQVQGAIMLAANARPLEELIIEQYAYLFRLQPGSALQTEIEKIKKQVEYLNSPEFNISSPAGQLPLGLPAAYWASLKSYNQTSEIKKTNIPVFILQGERDYQVTMTDYQLWQGAANNNPGITFKSYPRLNHLFMEGEGEPNPAEYQQKAHIPSYLISDIAEWILTLD